MDDVRDEVGNLNSEVAGSEVEADGVGSVVAEHRSLWSSRS